MPTTFQTNPRYNLLRTLFAMLCIALQSQAAVRYVSQTAADGGDGTSWTHAYRFLQDAISAAKSGDSVWVAAGTYYPDEGTGRTDNDVSSTFYLKDSIAVLGGFASGDTTAGQRNFTTRVTTLSGAIDGNTDTAGNAHNVVSFVDAGNRAVLEGFTITGSGGGSDRPDAGGGGIYCVSSGSNHVSSPRIINCKIYRNIAGNGGGMLVYSHARGTSSPTLTYCTFSENRSCLGGGVYCRADSGTCSAAFIKCTFNGNTAYYGEGGGIYSRAKVVLDSCTFDANRSSYDGGAMRSTDSATVVNCTFIGNRTGTDGGLGHGGAMYATGILTLGKCTIRGNYAEGSGGGLWTSGSAVLTGCTISANRAAGDGGGIVCSGRITLTDCIINRNRASGDGGGMENSGNATLANCTFSEDSASDWFGGGICNGSSLTLTSCTFTANHAYEGGGIYNGGKTAVKFTGCTFDGNDAGNGGGMFNSTNPELVACTFIRNRAAGSGGGIYNLNDPTLINCIISSNLAKVNGGGMFNDAYNYSPANHGTMHPRLISCVIAGNSAANGGGVCNFSGQYDDELGKCATALINCTLTGNGAAQGDGICNRTSNARGASACTDTLTNCILWNNGGLYVASDEILNDSAGTIVANCCIRGCKGSGVEWNQAFGTDKGGNIDADPRFITPFNSVDNTGDFQLGQFSPCIDAADGNVAPLSDNLGQSRFDDPGVINTGMGTPGYADMGAYERKSISTGVVPLKTSRRAAPYVSRFAVSIYNAAGARVFNGELRRSSLAPLDGHRLLQQCGLGRDRRLLAPGTYILMVKEFDENGQLMRHRQVLTRINGR